MRRHFQISANDALHVLPVWEIDLLLNQLAIDEYGGTDDQPAPSGEGRLTMTGEVD